MLLSAITSLVLLDAVQAASQVPIQDSSHISPEFQVYQSEISQKHSIRIKSQNSTLCDTPVHQYTGWLDHGSKHLFFWYFESESATSSAATTDGILPLTLWMNGGPGSSSMLGMLQELGPCLINKYGNGTVYNPYGWNKDTALVFVDQPVGVGFSYYDGDSNGQPQDSFASAHDMQIFLQMFTHQVFPIHRSGPLVLTGESYGGHYLPSLGAEIVRQNLLYPDHPQVNLKSIAMGNPLVSAADTAFGEWETLCTTKPGVSEPVFNKTRCDIIALNLPRCMEVSQTCQRSTDVAICHAAAKVCRDGITSLYDSEADLGEGSRNRYDISRPCEKGVFCYEASAWIEEYLNLNASRLALGVPQAIKNWTMMSEDVFRRFRETPDHDISQVPQVQYLLSNQIDVLVYSGNFDLACNTAGSKRWTSNMPWKGQAEFATTDLAPWKSLADGKAVIAGLAKEVNIKVKEGDDKKTRFALVTVDNAGHLVPQDQPEVALDLITRWLRNEPYI